MRLKVRFLGCIRSCCLTLCRVCWSYSDDNNFEGRVWFAQSGDHRTFTS